MSENIKKAQQLLDQRVRAYQQTFSHEAPAGKTVLEDLAKFCRAHESTFNPNDRAHALVEGRREVWLRIQSYIQLNDKQLWELYRKEK